MVNYLTSYVSEARRLYEAKGQEELAPLMETLDDEAMAKAVADYRAANPPPEVTGPPARRGAGASLLSFRVSMAVLMRFAMR